jgi:integrase
MFNNKIVRSNGRPYTKKENLNRFFFPNEFTKMYDKLKPKQKHMATVLINTGARINEARHIDLDKDVDYVNRRLTLRVTKIKAAKGELRGRVRILPISSQFTRYLKRYRDLHKSPSINFLYTSSFNTGVKRACRIAGLSSPCDFSAHSFRKTLETWLLALGLQDVKLLAHFGHDIRTAASHYVSPDIFSYEDKRLMREVIGDLYSM